MSKLKKVQDSVDNIVMEQDTNSKIRDGFVHLYSVSNFCTLLAKKRDLDMELCSICGLLHDIYKYRTGKSKDHAALGSIDSRKILGELKIFSSNEIDTICNAIYKHSDKEKIDGPYDEMLKDSDVLAHYFYDTSAKVDDNELSRLSSLLNELDLTE